MGTPAIETAQPSGLVYSRSVDRLPHWHSMAKTRMWSFSHTSASHSDITLHVSLPKCSQHLFCFKSVLDGQGYKVLCAGLARSTLSMLARHSSCSKSMNNSFSIPKCTACSFSLSPPNSIITYVCELVKIRTHCSFLDIHNHTGAALSDCSLSLFDVLR